METKTAWFWIDSVVRPLAADNIALGRPWYQNFHRLMKDREVCKAVSYEREELSVMVESQSKHLWKYESEKAVVKAVHDALRRRFAQAADLYRDNEHARIKKWETEYEKWRMAFVGARTADQIRRALSDLLSRAGGTNFLSSHWEMLLPMLIDKWQLTRDLALLALASYPRRSTDETLRGTGALDSDFDTENNP